MNTQQLPAQKLVSVQIFLPMKVEIKQKENILISTHLKEVDKLNWVCPICLNLNLGPKICCY